MDWECLMDCQGAQSQKGGQEDQGELLKNAKGALLNVLRSPGPPGLPLGGLTGSPSNYPKPSSYPYLEACAYH